MDIVNFICHFSGYNNNIIKDCRNNEIKIGIKPHTGEDFQMKIFERKIRKKWSFVKNQCLGILIFSGCMAFPIPGNALSCIAGKMNQETFSRLDLIVKGKISKILVKKTSTGFFLSIKVLKSWKGAKSGETIWIRYKKWGKKKTAGSYNTAGSYTVGETYMFYAGKESGAFVMGPCAGIGFSFRMSRKLKEFVESSPYIEKDPDDYLKSKFLWDPSIPLL